MLSDGLCVISSTSSWGDLFRFCAQIFTLAAYRKMYVHVQVQNTFRAPGFQQDLYYILIGNTSDLLKIIFWNCTYLDLCMARFQSCKNVPTVLTSWCYFFWPVLIFGKNTQKQAKTRKNGQKTGAFLVLIFWGGKLVGANFYAFCNYASILPFFQKNFG